MAATRITVNRDGRRVEVDVADDLSRATIEGRSYEVRLIAERADAVELEIAQQPVRVTGWPAPCVQPPAPVSVNGESWIVETARERAGGPVPELRPPTGAASAPVARSVGVGGHPVLPPMPGRILEVRVREGETVAAGAVLLVLEAMKMRNEVVAPVAGVVRSLSVREGTNVRARETMLEILPA